MSLIDLNSAVLINVFLFFKSVIYCCIKRNGVSRIRKCNLFSNIEKYQLVTFSGNEKEGELPLFSIVIKPTFY